MWHSFSFVLAQFLPYVSRTVVSVAPMDPARAHELSRTDYAVIGAVAVPIFAFVGSLVREHRRYRRISRDIRQTRCRFEPLVWVNTRSGIYYFEGCRWYKATREGMLLTQRVAEHRGHRPAKVSAGVQH